MDLTVKFKPRKIELEPKDIFNLSNLFDGEVVDDPTGKHKAGATIVINHGNIGSTKFPSIMFPAPNPIEFYLFSTLNNLQNIKKLESDVKNDQSKVNALLLEELQFCIFSVCALEAFLNQIIPATYEYDDNGTKITKAEIEKTWSLEDKLKKIVPAITKVSIAGDAVKWAVITDLIGLRNDLIHLKTSYPEISDFRSYQTLYKRLLDNDYDKSFSVLKDVISTVAQSLTHFPPNP